MAVSLKEIVEGFSCYVIGYDEARLIHREIFEDYCYDVANLSENPVIIDVGANIGLFSIYMKQKYPASQIIAFEPAVETFEVLKQNLELFGTTDGVKTYPFGLGLKAEVATMTYYLDSPGNSTLYPQEKEQLSKVITNVFGQEMSDKVFGRHTEISVSINRLSHFLLTDFANISSVDYLKIDVEGAELDVLGGIDDVHWDMTKNVVIEAGNNNGELAKIEILLRSKGFNVVIEKNPRLSEDKRFEEVMLWMILGNRNLPEPQLEESAKTQS
jgi:FkbM family methyltransferase